MQCKMLHSVAKCNNAKMTWPITLGKNAQKDFSDWHTVRIYIGHKKERKKMKNVKMKIVQEIVGLRFELDNYRNDRDWVMVRKIRLEIAKLEEMLSETY